MVIVFDLDDTLFPDISFVFSGFKAVGAYLHTYLGIDKGQIEGELCQALSISRNEVFDRVLKSHGVYSKQLVAS